MHQALNLAKAEGKAPGGVEETVKGAHASMLDWRALLRRYMTDAARRELVSFRRILFNQAVTSSSHAGAEIFGVFHAPIEL